MPESRPRVLLVEDHADTRLMYVEYFSLAYEVSEAADGLAALDEVTRNPPDVIVTDLALPRMDGYELIERIRADERLRGIPIIALSGYTSGDHDARLKKVAPTSVLKKPCLPDSLLQEVEKHLRAAGGPAS